LVYKLDDYTPEWKFLFGLSRITAHILMISCVSSTIPMMGPDTSLKDKKSRGVIRYIKTHRTDEYQNKVIYTYDDPPDVWHKALGENLSFQFGLFDETEIEEGPKPGSIGPSEYRHFDRQLEIAGLLAPERPVIRRILDLGCGWGFISKRIATHFPECQTIDAINISQRQLEYCTDNLPDSLQNRVNLYFCNGQDVDLLPDDTVGYDLVVVRGVYTHFLHDVFEASIARVAQRMNHGGILVISDTLYKVLVLSEDSIHGCS
jgi:cyclopropane fatty-acyl-phospholipid synthase-like methyltransferase